MSARAELFRHAARCYHSAGYDDDACRCYEAAQDFLSAAQIHERAERWLPAAALFARAGQWPSAARAYLGGNQPNAAADALLKAGEPAEAAWLFADQCRLFAHSRSLAQALGDSPVPAAERVLILARCDAGGGQPAAAGRGIRGYLGLLGKIGAAHARRRLDQWALSIAALIRRPDLAALIHSAAVAERVPNSFESWQDWASATLKDASGIRPPDPLSAGLTGSAEVPATPTLPKP